VVYFFFSSRRRHTRFSRDWSSDVCSSDLYAPLAHATWHPDGVLGQMGVLDFAGGTVVHMSAGLTALASAIYLKQGKTAKEHTPARITYVLLGTGLLWFGWFGFNAGSAFAA